MTTLRKTGAAATSRDLGSFDVRRVTTGSMPTPTQFGGVFWGDYSGVAALDRAYPFWSDSRSRDLLLCPGTATAGNPPRLCGLDTAVGPANDEDVFAATIRGRGGLGGDASQD